MSVWLYCICRDEQRILPYFLRHYTTFVDKLIFYDDGSVDGTPDLIRDCPKADLRKWPFPQGLMDDHFLDFANEQWKEARGHAYWVIWVDVDEFLYHPRILDVLDGYAKDGVELPLIDGYTMISHSFPTTQGQIYDEIRTGVPDNRWCKPAIFHGHIQWTVGRHGINDRGFNPKRSAVSDIKLLHYRCLGLDYLKQRHARNWSRVPERCRQANYGTNCSPGFTGTHGVAWFEEQLSKPLVNVI